MPIPGYLSLKHYDPEPSIGEGYSLRTIEFDDQGELWEPQQLEDTLAHIQKECEDSQARSNDQEGVGEVVVITFIHGWMHSAAPGDQNFDRFSDLISNRAKAEADFARENHRHARPIIGVYLAWRGLNWNLPILKFFTFWSRKSAALRVGHLSCTEVIFRIIRTVKARNSRSQCIFVGHSFGGLIMENAICKALLGTLFLNEGKNEGQSADSPSDLVVLINPACEASGAKQFIDILERNKVVVEMGEGEKRKERKQNLPFPMLISITSAGDLATKLAFPVGQFLVNLPKSFRPYPDAKLPRQRHLSSHTAGHVTHFHNFEVKPGSDITSDRKIPGLSFDGEQQEYHIVLKEKGYKPLPFWLMQVPKEIVPNHSDIFTKPFVNMLSTLLHWSMTEVETTKLKCNRPEYSASQVGLT